jgi:hypothetical protein
MYPTGGNGASQAILDARSLTDHVASGVQAADALAAGGNDAKLVIYPIHRDPATPDVRLTNWAVMARLGDASQPPPRREDWNRPGRLDEALPFVRDTFQLDFVDLAARIKATGPFFEFPCCDRDPLPPWCRRSPASARPRRPASRPLPARSCSRSRPAGLRPDRSSPGAPSGSRPPRPALRPRPRHARHRLAARSAPPRARPAPRMRRAGGQCGCDPDQAVPAPPDLGKWEAHRVSRFVSAALTCPMLRGMQRVGGASPGELNGTPDEERHLVYRAIAAYSGNLKRGVRHEPRSLPEPRISPFLLFSACSQEEIFRILWRFVHERAMVAPIYELAFSARASSVGSLMRFATYRPRHHRSIAWSSLADPLTRPPGGARITS